MNFTLAFLSFIPIAPAMADGCFNSRGTKLCGDWIESQGDFRIYWFEWNGYENEHYRSKMLCTPTGVGVPYYDQARTNISKKRANAIADSYCSWVMK